MNNYLEIAEAILRRQRRPLGARAILRAAYVERLVPHRYYGQTQHKTLQARLSEDILSYGEQSRFFRTGPGRFFLREFLHDAALPKEFRKEVFARRRSRDLVRGPILCVDASTLREVSKGADFLQADEVLQALNGRCRYSYEEIEHLNEDAARVWVFTTVRRNGEVLTYRAGRYRDERDSFVNRRSIGLTALVVEGDRTLFDASGLGISESGITAFIDDLTVSRTAYKPSNFPHRLRFFFWSEPEESNADTKLGDIVAVLDISVPDWFEPLRGRLSINDLQWMNTDVAPNNLDDFDPWSKIVLKHCILSDQGYSYDRRISDKQIGSGVHSERNRVW